MKDNALHEAGKQLIVESTLVTTDFLWYSETILQEVLKSKNANDYSVTNSLLEHLGLIKSENKQQKEVKDMRGPFLVIAKSAKSLSPTQKKVLHAFVTK